MNMPLKDPILVLLISVVLSGCQASDMLQPVENPIPAIPNPNSNPNPVSNKVPSLLAGVYDLRALSVEPTVLHSVTPNYPSFWRREGIGGQALVVFTVKPDGSVADVMIAKATDVLFGQAAAAAVSKWTFRPGEVNGRLVYTRMAVPITFSAEKTN